MQERLTIPQGGGLVVGMGMRKKIFEVGGRARRMPYRGGFAGALGVALGLSLVFCGAGFAEGWRASQPGWSYEFPRDHASHGEFQTEWWYFTGNLRAKGGREFGYQLTFFRQGIRPPGSPAAASRFVIDDLPFAHFALTDLAGGRFHHFQEVSRGVFGEAGFGEGERLAWIGDWSCERTGPHTFRLRASEADVAVDLWLESSKPPVIHGKNGVSQKAEGEGRASHYYSLSRLATRGTVSVGGESFEVEGSSWFDHEWATNQLAPHQRGWDWFSLQLDDGTDLMLFQIRTDGGRDTHSGGTFVRGDGSAIPIENQDFALEPVDWWVSPETGGKYPVGWRLAIPKLALELKVGARMDRQELAAQPFAYWEGTVQAAGNREGRALRGTGYLEMTGYAGRIIGLQAPEK